MKLGKFIFLSLLLVTIFVISNVISLSRASASSSSSLLVDIIPPNPAPGENTSINLNSYADNLDTVLITWSVDGKKALSGIGKKSFSVNAPAAGLETTVTASVSLPDGQVDTRIIIRPSVMVLLWQANDSFVPPFYKGKSLPTADSEIKVVALPETKLANAKNMTYAWKKDYTNDVEGSGYGKNSFVFTNDYLENSNNISVTASTIDQQYSASAQIDIGVTQPKIVFYKNDNSLGTIWEQALGNPHRISGNETVQAVPYFIAPKELLNPSLVWSWFINNNPVTVPIFRKNYLPLQTQAGVSGTSTVKLQIENRDRIFETASKEINIEF